MIFSLTHRLSGSIFLNFQIHGDSTVIFLLFVSGLNVTVVRSSILCSFHFLEFAETYMAQYMVYCGKFSACS